MSMLIDPNIKVITQGITGRAGRIYTKACIDYGHGRDCFVAGVNPKKVGETIFDIPIYGTVKEARDATGATASIIYVPAASAIDAIWEAIEAEMDWVICATYGIPIQDLLRLHSKIQAKEDSSHKKTILLGPGSPGIMIPEMLKVGMIPEYTCDKGCIGVVTSTGTLTYEVVAQLASVGLAPSMLIGLGKGCLHGMNVIDVLQMYNADVQTKAIVLVVEGVWRNVMDVANWCKNNKSKPVIVYIVKTNLYVEDMQREDCSFIYAQRVLLDEVARSYGFVVAKTMMEVGVLVREQLKAD